MACGSVPLRSRRGRPGLEQGALWERRGRAFEVESPRSGTAPLRLDSPPLRHISRSSRSHGGGADPGRLSEGGSGCTPHADPSEIE